MENRIEHLKREFTDMVIHNISREGIADLMQWLSQTDFYTSPASTRHHGAEEGGLVAHSLNVFNHLSQLAELYGLGDDDGVQDPCESIAIVALFHDFCKIGCYKTETRWRKDANNRWESYSSYKFEEDYCFGGHGSKSVYLVQNFIKLTPVEAAAINCHMGAWDSTTYSNPSPVYERNKLAWLLHVADEAATYISEV